MRIIYLALFSFCFLTGFSQNNPVLSKVTATWCPTCGAWGWDYMEAMKSEFATGPALPLGVHYSGDLQNPAAAWWASNLNSSGQPKFYLNNELLAVTGNTWSDAIATTKTSADGLAPIDQVDFDFETLFIENGTLNVSVDITKIPNINNRLHVGVYVYENNVINQQSQQGPDASHPNVLRASIGDEMQGQHIVDFQVYDFSMEVDAAWTEDELGVLAVVWEETNDGFVILASQAVSGVSGLSSNDEILNSSEFTFANGEGELIISTENKDTYELSFSNLQGQLITSTSFQYETAVSKSSLVSGMYIATIRNGNKVLSQQVFVK